MTETKPGIQGVGTNALVGKRTNKSKSTASGKKLRKIKWGDGIKEDVASLVLREEIELYEFLRVARKFERKCVREMKKLKGTVRARKLLLLTCDILRNLKLVSNELSGNVPKTKIYAAFGLILTHAISAAMRRKGSPENAQKSALNLLEFIRRILDFNSNWIFTTILSSDVVSTEPADSLVVNPFSRSLLSLLVNDPLLVLDVDAVGRKAKAALLLVKPATSKSKAQFSEGWTTQEGFCKRLELSEVSGIVNDCKKRLKIRIPKGSQSLPVFDESADCDNAFDIQGVSWGISTTPGNLYEGSDSDSAESTVELEDTTEFSEVDENEAADSDEPFSKRVRIQSNEDQSTDEDNGDN